MDGWQKICEQWLGWSTEKLKTVAHDRAQNRKNFPSSQQQQEPNGRPMRLPKTEVKLGGLLSEIKEVTTKKGSKMAFGQLEDLRGKVEIVFFPEAYAQTQEIIKRAIVEAEVLVVSGEVEFGDETPKVFAKSLEWASEAHRGRVQKVLITLVPSEVSPDQLRELKKNLLQGRGKCPVQIYFVDASFKTSIDLPKTLGISANPQTILSINRIFGKDVVSLH